MKQSLSIKIPDDLIQKLQEISKAESKPIGELVKELIQKYISAYQRHQLKSFDFSDEDIDNLFMQQMNSKSYLDWVDTENDIYDEVFADEIT